MKNNYDVGYCKPPKETQFKRGYSGNMKGRPKKDKDDFFNIISSELQEKISLNNGHKITKEQAICKQFVNSAVNGQKDAIKQVVDLQTKWYKKKKSEKFVDKLMKEKYISPEGINKFLHGDNIDINGEKVSNAICCINMNAKYKQGEANMAFLSNLFLSDMLWYVSMCLLSKDYINTVREEFYFYEGIDAVLEEMDKSEEEKAQIIKHFENSRGYTRPSQEVYDCTCEFETFSLYCILRKLSLLRDSQKQISGYEEVKNNFLDNKEKKLIEFAKTHPSNDVEILRELIEEMQRSYKICEKKVFSFKNIDETVKSLGFSLETIAPYIEWLSKNDTDKEFDADI